MAGSFFGAQDAANAQKKAIKQAQGIEQQNLAAAQAYEQKQAGFNAENAGVAKAFTGRADSAETSLLNFANSGLGQSELFQRARDALQRDTKRALSSQGGVFSGRFGRAISDGETKLLQSEMDQRLNALNSISSRGSAYQQLLQSSNKAVSPELSIKSRNNLANLALGKGQADAQGISAGTNAITGAMNSVAGGGMPGLGNIGSIFSGFGGGGAQQQAPMTFGGSNNYFGNSTPLASFGGGMDFNQGLNLSQPAPLYTSPYRGYQ
jgi:hypothetical protein